MTDCLADDPDVVVVGGGNAALCAALAAAESGSRVLVLERAPVEQRGGNTAYAGGGMRVPYRGLEDLAILMADVEPSELAQCDFGGYSDEDFFKDLARVTEHRCDPNLAELLVTRSFDTLQWMATKGVRFIPSYARQSYEVNGRRRFWGGVPLEVSGGGAGLVDALTKAAFSAGVQILYDARVVQLLLEDRRVRGVVTVVGGVRHEVGSGAVVLGSGGFEANAEWRTRYLGPGWELAKVRGSRYNTGDGIRIALEVGASSVGHWSGCHAVGWDLNAPEFGDLNVGHGFNKHHYHLGIMVNARGERFVDEGADIRNYTYAKYGQEIMRQPGQFAWQIFDGKVTDLLQRDYYRHRHVTAVRAGTLDELVAGMEGVDAEGCLETIEEFNRSIGEDLPSFDPTIKDGRHTSGLPLAKSNWANTITEPPFEAYAVTCGITFTFGGLRVSQDAQVIDGDGAGIPGLYACGELVGGLFYFNYPGGSGLTWGSVMGRIAGNSAGVLTRHR